MGRLGPRITATDWSPQMIARTTERAGEESVTDRLEAMAVGAHELQRLEGEGSFDGAYSNLGPLNCVPDLADVSSAGAPFVGPGGGLGFAQLRRVVPVGSVLYAMRV